MDKDTIIDLVLKFSKQNSIPLWDITVTGFAALLMYGVNVKTDKLEITLYDDDGSDYIYDVEKVTIKTRDPETKKSISFKIKGRGPEPLYIYTEPKEELVRYLNARIELSKGNPSKAAIFTSLLGCIKEANPSDLCI